jgi:hypothetical protein
MKSQDTVSLSFWSVVFYALVEHSAKVRFPLSDAEAASSFLRQSKLEHSAASTESGV